MFLLVYVKAATRYFDPKNNLNINPVFMTRSPGHFSSSGISSQASSQVSTEHTTHQPSLPPLQPPGGKEEEKEAGRGQHSLTGSNKDLKGSSVLLLHPAVDVADVPQTKSR